MKTRTSQAIVVVAFIGCSAFGQTNATGRTYELWEPEQAPNRGADFGIIKARGFPFDQDWEEWSYPIGNGYMGANLFGRVDTERIQITDKTLCNKGVYNRGGITSFAEVYLDFNHRNISNYRRSLNLNEAIAHVSYEAGGTKYTREYFMSYPDNVLVIRMDADRKGSLSFRLRVEIPHSQDPARKDDRIGKTVVTGDLLTYSGTSPYFNMNYEAQVKVMNEGGTLSQDEERGTITVSHADSATLVLALGTNYRLRPEVFTNKQHEKLDSESFPHERVSKTISDATDKGYAALKRDHLKDYQNLFNRVVLNLNSTVPNLPTHLLLENYKAGQHDTYLEELMFQYGRYLLIASSRENTLPANLQGVWSQYDYTPWSGGYWHNINVQMNYWGAMSANLAETFLPYIDFFKAYLPAAHVSAKKYLKSNHPKRVSSDKEGNGWIIGTGANPFFFPDPGGHSGPGTGGFTSKILVEYYNYTQDKDYLRNVAYPAVLSLSRFFSKTLVENGDGLLLVTPSASPEQRITDPRQIEGKPGHLHSVSKNYYITTGCTFDQGFVWETYNDTLKLAKALGSKDEFLKVIESEIFRLDPILIGDSGQIKEYREETFYSEIGDPKHRHISHLCAVYPGTLINSSTPEWMEAASKTLDLRGHTTTGWAVAHRMNCRARLGQGNKALEAYQYFIAEKTVPNLWTLHPPFQIDGNLGVMAGVAEMLLQSHEGYIKLLPALPEAWSTGFCDGLVARGNFVLSMKWKDGKPTAVSITSRSGGICRIACPGTEFARVKDSLGKTIESVRDDQECTEFQSVKGETYLLAL